MTNYNKVRRNFEELERTTGVKIIDCSKKYKIDLANELAAIAKRHGIRMYWCCGDDLTRDGYIEKAHCIDARLIENLFFPDGLKNKEKPATLEWVLCGLRTDCHSCGGRNPFVHELLESCLRRNDKGPQE